MRVASALKNKIRDAKAFTLSEALVAIIILLLVTSIVAAGIPAAARAYKNVVEASNAEVMLSNTLVSLRNELGMATDVSVSDDGSEITYFNPMYDSLSKLTVSENDDIKYIRYASDDFIMDENAAESDELNFASQKKAANDDGMHVKCEKVSYSNGVVEFTNLKVYNSEGEVTSVSRASYKIRVVTD